jgi:hypothetical protein
MQARLDGRDPEHDADAEVDRAAPDPGPRQRRDRDQGSARDGDRDDVEVAGVDDPDQRHGHDVVGDGQCQQEDPQLGRDPRPDDRQRAEHEGGVGRDHHAPAASRVAGRGNRQVDQRRHDHAADSGDRRDRHAPAIGQLADRQLAAHLEPDHEEEQRHQPVADPVGEVHLQRQVAEPDRQLGPPQVRVAV